MTSSVAFSNYANISVDDPNNPGLADVELQHSAPFHVPPGLLGLLVG